MKNYLQLFLCILPLILYACNGDKTKDADTIDFSKLEQKELIIDDHFDVKKIVPLETTTESNIVYISKVFSSDHNIIILDNFGNAILFFDADGNFISKISRIGRGPGEYINLSDMMVDFENEEIRVLDGCDTKKMITYSFTGEFLSERGVNMCADSFYRLNDGSYVFYVPTDNSLADNKTVEFTNIVVTDSLMQYKWSAMPFNQKWSGRSFSVSLVNSTFSKNLHKILYLPQIPHNLNCIYEVTPTSIEPHLNIAFHDNSKLSALLDELNPEGDVHGDLSKSGLDHSLHNFAETPDGIVFSILRNNGEKAIYCNVVYAFGNNHYYQLTNDINPRHGLFSPYPITTADGNLVMVNETSSTQVLDNNFELFENLKPTGAHLGNPN
jgi:hypothetical protein